MVTEHTFPSDVFPGPLPVRLRMPSDWAPQALPSVAMSFVHAASPVGVPTNLLVVVNRVGGDPTLDDLAAAVRDQVVTMSGAPARVRSSTVRQVAGRHAIHTVLGVAVPARDLHLTQVQTVFAAESAVDGLHDVVQVHLTCRDDQWPLVEPTLEAALTSMNVGWRF